MKLHQDNVEIKRVGVQTENSFTIKATAKSFDILSSGLYTDPIAAIIREISCNAYDSHVAANKKDVPFKIHLPNSLEPFLSIRDFGTGLSDEDVLHLYTTYFESTKTQSNDFVGALGLGSKSPFSYSKSYEVISIFDGMIRSYHMFINEHGIPDVARMFSNATDEDNGLEIKLAVDPTDFNRFINKTASVLKHFTVKPTIVGALHFEFDKLPPTLLSGDNWIAFNRTGNHYPTPLTVIQGNVQYKVSINQLTEELTATEIKAFQQIQAVLSFDIGDIEFAANREEVRYDDNTKKNLVKEIKKMFSDISERVALTCHKYDNKWERYIKLTELSYSLFNSMYALVNMLDEKSTISPRLREYLNSSGNVRFPEKIVGHYIYRYQTNHSLKSNYSRSTPDAPMTPSDRTRFIFNDVKRGGIFRLTEYLKEHDNIEVIYLITPSGRDFDSDDDKKQYPGYPEAELPLILKAVGGPEITNLSDTCPIIQREIPERILKTYRYDGTQWGTYGKSICWQQSEFVESGSGGLYFVLKYGTEVTIDYGKNTERPAGWSVSDTSNNLSTIATIFNEREGCNKYSIDDIKGIPVTTWRLIKNDPNWINVFDVISDTMPSTHHFKTYVARSANTPENYGLIGVIATEQNRNRIKRMCKESPFYQTVKQLVSDRHRIGNSTKYQIMKFYSQFNNVNMFVDDTPYFGYIDFNKYPLISTIKTLPSNPDEFKKILDYIKLVDNKDK